MMDKKKQIEEMANLICRSKNPSMEKQCSECVFDCMCDIQDGCEVLIDNGYRLASEVAREIFAEIEEMLNMQVLIARTTRDCEINAEQPEMSLIAMLEGGIYSLRVVEKHIAELKKKYTEGER